MNETDARCFTLIRAVEECDADGALLSLATRRRATREAGPPSGPAERADDAANDGFLARRARILCERLAAVQPDLARLAEGTAWRPWLVSAALAIATIVGFASAEIGPGQRLHLLSFPLLGLLAWNIVFYVALMVAAVSPRRASAVDAPPWWLRIAQRGRRAPGTESSSKLPERVTAAFLQAWTRHTVQLRGAELRQVLHLSAAALAIGLVAGLYVRGLVLEYRAGWESTFIDAPTLAAVLEIVFGPAAWMTGIPLPDTQELSRLAWGAGTEGENAARWIHLAAVTAGLFIVAPRLALAWQAGRQASRWRRSLRVYSLDGYTRPLLAAGHGGGEVVVVIPLGYSPPEATTSAIREASAALLGGRCRVDVRPAVAYGEEQVRSEALPAELPPPPVSLVTLVNLAVTPEAETHGDWLRGLRPLAQSGAVARVVVLADGGGYRAALVPGEAERRLAERFAAWEALVTAHDLPLVRIDNLNPAALADAVRPHLVPSPSAV